MALQVPTQGDQPQQSQGWSSTRGAPDVPPEQFGRTPSEDAVVAPLLGRDARPAAAVAAAAVQQRASLLQSGGLGLADEQRQQEERRQEPTGDAPSSSTHVRCTCGNYFKDDSAFCRKCGARRPGGADAPQEPAASTPRLDADGPSEALPSKPLLHLQVVMYFTCQLLDFSCLALAILIPVKAWYFYYPLGWQVADAVLVALCFATGRARGYCISAGNRTQSVPPLAASQGLAASVVLLVGYFAGLQIYVLQVEFILGLVLVILLTTEVFLACVAGLLASERGRDTALSIIGTVIGGIAVAMALAFILLGGHTKVFGEAARAASFTFAGVGGAAAIASLAFLLDVQP